MTAIALALSGCSGRAVRTESKSSNVAKSSPADPTKVPLVGSFEVHRYELPNGLKVLIVEDHSSPTLSYQTWFNVGSRNEEKGRTGLAHLFEHMMFKGTTNYKDGEFDKILEGAGSEGTNAFTNRDYTAYVQELPSDKLETIVRMESDRMVNLIVDEKAFKTETEVVQNERRFRYENNPDGLIYQELFAQAFTVHPYHWPVIGYQEDLEAMTAEDARKFYKTFYSPNHATIVIAGDVKPDSALELIRRYYGSIPAQPSPGQALAAEPEQTAVRRKNLPLNIQVEKLLVGFRTPPYVHPDTPTLALLQGILAGGKSSRLQRALVDTGIASTVYTYDLDDKDPSLFLISANLQKGKRAAQAEAIILKEIQRLAKELVPQKELERAKNKITFGFYEGLNSNAEKTRFLGQFEIIAGDFQEGIRMFERIQSITAEQLREVVAKYLKPNTRTVITGVPK